MESLMRLNELNDMAFIAPYNGSLCGQFFYILNLKAEI